MCTLANQALGQASLQIRPENSSDTLTVTLTDAPAKGIAVIWRSTQRLAKGDHWSAVHAFPLAKRDDATFPIRPSAGQAAFFKLSWQAISLPDQLVWIPPGQFRMGSPEGEEGRFLDEGPVHDASVPYGFWMERYEITQQRYRNLMGENPSSTEFLPELPVNRITWHEAVEFCQRLTDVAKSKGELPKGYIYRLPTETEWAYACRAGTQEAYSYGASADPLSEYGWWAGNSGNQPEPVGKLRGLYDMHGNLFEWCADAYLAYPDGSAFSTSGTMKVLRGGAYY